MKRSRRGLADSDRRRWLLSGLLIVTGIASSMVSGCQEGNVADIPPPVLSISSDSTCPGSFQDKCGPASRCTVLDPQSSLAADLIMELGGHTGGWDCEVGRGGATDALEGGHAYLIHSMSGICIMDGVTGFHDSNTGTIGILAPTSFNTQLHAAFHEGWSFSMQCSDTICHDETFLNQMEDVCYPL
jgi:hypothetical protein